MIGGNVIIPNYLSEILFNIESEFSDIEVNARQLLNHVSEFDDHYLLRAYGKILKFNKDGDLI